MFLTLGVYSSWLWLLCLLFRQVHGLSRFCLVEMSPLCEGEEGTPGLKMRQKKAGQSQGPAARDLS